MISKNPLKKTPFFVAEVSANHNGSLPHAKKLIKIAKKYGADAVKLQSYTPNTMTIESNKLDFKIDNVFKPINLIKSNPNTFFIDFVKLAIPFVLLIII